MSDLLRNCEFVDPNSDFPADKINQQVEALQKTMVDREDVAISGSYTTINPEDLAIAVEELAEEKGIKPEDITLELMLEEGYYNDYCPYIAMKYQTLETDEEFEKRKANYSQQLAREYEHYKKMNGKWGK